MLDKWFPLTLATAAVAFATASVVVFILVAAAPDAAAVTLGGISQHIWLTYSKGFPYIIRKSLIIEGNSFYRRKFLIVRDLLL